VAIDVGKGDANAILEGLEILGSLAALFVKFVHDRILEKGGKLRKVRLW
jgi:hypothetical protein